MNNSCFQCENDIETNTVFVGVMLTTRKYEIVGAGFGAILLNIDTIYSLASECHEISTGYIFH